ncbi:hypothetical protein [Streptomyces akebiae]|uniref:hypothetical protein n=1 Tax=Streptomyces akebiae TaxID=2865673 RepID=UPI002175D2D9|nr:hypothetical protein [Streptomyces akebiae]
MRTVLEARQKAAAVRVEELEAELEQLRAALAAAEEVLRHRVIGLEQHLEALAEEDAPTVAVVLQQRQAYRAIAPINTIVVSGIALYEEVQEGTFFGLSLGADQDLVRLADPEYHVLDSRIGRAHRRIRAWREGRRQPAGRSGSPGQ